MFVWLWASPTAIQTNTTCDDPEEQSLHQWRSLQRFCDRRMISELINKNCFSTIHPDDVAEVSEVFEQKLIISVIEKDGRLLLGRRAAIIGTLKL